MYQKDWTESTNAALMLDKNARKAYNKKKRNIFDDDEIANSAVDSLYRVLF